MQRLSIVMATYNASPVVKNTISSIASQDAFDPAEIEVLLMDGASSDDTVDLARASGIFRKVISRHDAGVYDAMNSGIEHATGRWIQFLNAGDTFVNETSLRQILAALERAEEEDAMWMVAGARNLAAGGATIRNMPHNWLRHSLGLQPHCHQATFFRRSALIGIGGHSLDFGTAGDFDVILRLGFATGNPAETHDVVINYEGGGMSDVAPAETAKRLAAVRSARFHLVGALASLNTGVAWVLGGMNVARIKIGRVRRKMRSWRRNGGRASR